MSEEVSAEVIKKTQRTLGKYVKKPQLTDKLLKKPPFRFLHDIITSLIKETGFLKGLFTDDEMISDNVKDKDAKVAFLNKLIEAVKTASGTKLSVKANKIVAGLEATNTNLLLQAIAKCLDSNIDTKQFVTNFKSDKQIEKNKKNITKISKEDKGSTHKKLDTPKNSKNVQSSVRKEEGSKVKLRKTSKNEDKVNRKHLTEKESPSTDDDKAKNDKKENVTVESVEKAEKMEETGEHETTMTGNIENIPKLELNPKEEEHNNIVKKEDNLEKEENINKNQIRPKSARPRSGDMEKMRIDYKNETVQENEGSSVLKSSHASRPKSSLRPPSVRPSSARPGAPRLRLDSAIPMHEPIPMGTINVIVENVDSMADEEETVVIETATAESEPVQIVHEIELDNKGHLVEQILEQIEGDSTGGGKKMDIERENNIVKTREGVTKEIAQLADVIQNLTKTANPLGKLINFLHEDIEAMHSELQLWINTKKQLYSEIRKQKKSNIESNKPLLTHLEQLNHDIKKIQQEITNINCNMLKNDNRIKELLC
ncbi:TRAF3-interacting protein 1 [Diorhabda sublineata]|uniref:TRAF3-interacting protein 1 n=1 Tax=Diorhabda sublineata TaxID=1163346 RepID=UPI0024E165F1|nr:TRAF3-interacting protein 1 [Diorhabda sublineata]